MVSIHIPHCPKCPETPTATQHQINARTRDGIKGALRKWLEVKFDSAYRCSVCRACYSFQDGCSSFLGYIPYSTLVDPP
jgi:hypothetical protein